MAGNESMDRKSGEIARVYTEPIYMKEPIGAVNFVKVKFWSRFYSNLWYSEEDQRQESQF